MKIPWKTIMGIWVHPDDEVVLSGGLMAAAVVAGAKVTCVTATAGELGVQDAAYTPGEVLGRRRRRELAGCLKELGVHEQRFLGLRDGHLAKIELGEGERLVYRILQDVRPEAVLTFSEHGYTGHPDHKAVGRWVLGACRKLGPDGPELYVEAVTPEWRNEFRVLLMRANLFYSDKYPVSVLAEGLDIDFVLPDMLYAQKLKAMHQHASQMEAMERAMGGMLEDLPEIWRREMFRRVRY